MSPKLCIFFAVIWLSNLLLENWLLPVWVAFHVLSSQDSFNPGFSLQSASSLVLCFCSGIDEHISHTHTHTQKKIWTQNPSPSWIVQRLDSRDKCIARLFTLFNPKIYILVYMFVGVLVYKNVFAKICLFAFITFLFSFCVRSVPQSHYPEWQLLSQLGCELPAKQICPAARREGWLWHWW